MKKIFIAGIILLLIINLPLQLSTISAKAETGGLNPVTDGVIPPVTPGPPGSDSMVPVRTTIHLVRGSDDSSGGHSSGHHFKQYHSHNDKELADEKQNMKIKNFAALKTRPPLVGTITAQVSQITSSVGFDGLTMSQSGGWYPPDFQVAAGPTKIMELVNLAGKIFNKDGTAVSSFTLFTFFKVPTTHFLSDPKVLYDSTSQRWFASLSDITTSSVLLAVSTSTDPSGSWNVYSISFGNCADQPILGLNDNKVVLSANMFTNSCGANGGTVSFTGAKYVIIDKTGVVSGSATVNAQSVGPVSSQFSVHPVQSIGSTAPNFPLYMVSEGYGYTSTVQLSTITGAVPNAAISVVSLAVKTVGTPPDAIQPGTTTLIATGDARVQDAKWFAGNIWLASSDGCTPVGDNAIRSCLHLTEISTTSSAIIQDFFYGANGLEYYYPALGIDGNGNLDLIYGFSSATAYPSLAVTGQVTGDPAGTLRQPLTIKSGSAIDASGRFGDFFGAGVDPANPSLVWVGGEYHSAPTIDWSTFIGTVSMSSSPLDATTTLVTPNPTTATGGGQKQFTGKVSDNVNPANIPTGSIQWNDGGAGGSFNPGSCTLVSGSCSITYTVPSHAGPVKITGVYNPDLTHSTSSGFSSLTVTVTSFPITVMSDTTASFASLISAPRQFIGELATPASVLVGKQIDSITLNLQKVGAPTGTAQVGIFDINRNVVKSFGTIDVSTISTTAIDYEFKLATGSPYAISSGDRIGFKYTGGSTTVGVNVTPDRDAADPFDGANSYRVRYEAAWIDANTEDMYMILKLTGSSTSTPFILLKPSSGIVGSAVNISGNNFTPSSTMSIKFNGVAQTTNPATITTNSTGGFTGSISVPASSLGSFSISATDASTNTASSQFTVNSSVSTIVMSDTTASFASLISAPRQFIGELATPASVLVGKQIDSITIQLQKVGAPTGTAQVGIFDINRNVVKSFGTIDISTISTTATVYEFKLLSTDPLYAIKSGDRIGFKYTGGSATVGVNVTPDRDAADPFDGANSYRVRYEAAWVDANTEDMYMILKQTHG